MEIFELADVELDYVKNVIERAQENDQTVKLAVQGGRLIIKRGAGVWTAGLGYKVDGNGDRV